MRAPKFWQRRGLRATALTPLGWVYDGLGRLRRAFGKCDQVSVPVICIGNVVAGGAGKTPTTFAVVDYLKRQGLNVHVLGYGYGGLEHGPLRVDPERHTFRHVGDEALLLAKVAPTWIGYDRRWAARLAVDQGADVLVMDDGFQYPFLHKDLNIVVVDGGYGLGNRKVIPAGPLRESLGRADLRADHYLIVGEDTVDVSAALPFEKIIRGRYHPVPENDGDVLSLEGRRIVAFAAIGRPAKFFEMLKGLGAEILASHSFPDHYPFQTSDLALIFDQARALGAEVFTTAKDAVRLPPELVGQYHVLDIELRFDEDGTLERTLGPLLTQSRVAA